MTTPTPPRVTKASARAYMKARGRNPDAEIWSGGFIVPAWRFEVDAISAALAAAAEVRETGHAWTRTVQTSPTDVSIEMIARVLCRVRGHKSADELIVATDGEHPIWHMYRVEALNCYSLGVEYSRVATPSPDARDAALEEAAKVADRFDAYGDCEALGFMDPSTGARECSIDVKGGNCLCNEQAEAAEKIAAKIRALKGKKNA